MGGGIARPVRNDVQKRRVENVRQKVQEGLYLCDVDVLRKLFEQNCDPSNGKLTKSKFLKLFPSGALTELSIQKEDGFDFEDFKRLIQVESPFLKWIASLPISRTFADALSSASGAPGACGFDGDPLRAVSTLTSEEVNMACDCCLDVIKAILSDEVRRLKEAFVLTDDKAKAQNQSASKFEVFTMSCGDICDFHKGLIGRIGALSLWNP